MIASRPSLQELIDLVIPHCAAKWKFIGSLLGLSQSVLDIIEHDHRSAIDCCIKMWTKWLDTDTTATWRTVLNALDHEAVTETEKSNHHLHMYMYVLQQVEWLCFATINMCASFIHMYHTYIILRTCKSNFTINASLLVNSRNVYHMCSYMFLII